MASSTDISCATGGSAVDISGGDATLYSCRGFHVGVAGDVKVDFAKRGTGITLKGCSAGATYPYQITKIYQTGTTATDIVALY